MFVRAPNPIWFLVDLVGLPLNDQYYAFFLTNTLPYLPQNVYRDPQGMSVWTNDIVQFLPNGTLPDNLYFDPTLTYRIEIRQGPDQTFPLIYEINNFVPGNGSSIITSPLSILFAENQTSNDNFSQVDFTSTLLSSQPTITFTAAGTYPVAPGWNLILTGTGSTTLTQQIYAGNTVTTQPNSPNYGLRIISSGWTTAVLSQTFNHNGAIFAGGAISMSIMTAGIAGAPSLQMNYVPSVGSPITVLNVPSVPIGNYVTYTGTINLPVSTNSDLSTTANVQMQINLPIGATIDITDVQMVGQNSPIIDPTTGAPYPTSTNISTVVPVYQQTTEERKTDHLFHYYAEDLITKPKKSLLAGWNFPLNPYQFISSTITTVTAITSYIADQTILHQEEASQLQSGKNSVDQRGNLVIKAVNAAATTRFALIQYIDPATIAPFWSYVLSAFARARIFTSHGTQVRLKARLIWRTTLPTTIGNTEPISSWAANSDPAFSAGWTAITPVDDPAYILPNAYDTGSTTNEYPGFTFNGFQLPDSQTATMTLGIVIYTMDNLNSTDPTEDYIAFDKVSLIPSDFGADAAAQTYEQALEECQFYYETSYDTGIVPGSADVNGALVKYQQAAVDNSQSYFIGSPFGIEFKTVKRKLGSTITIYAPSNGSSNAFDAYLSGRDGASFIQSSVQAFSTNYNILIGTNVGNKGVGYYNVNAAVITTAAHSLPTTLYVNANMYFHYTADARLGV